MIRVLWFSPLPPALTDIANYTMRILPALRERVDLVLVHPEGTDADPAYGAVSTASLSPQDLNAADLCVYHIGNNPSFHDSILEIAGAHPGIVVLHDRVINQLYLGMLASNERETGERLDQCFRAIMASWYGAAGLREADEFLEGTRTITQLSQRFPLFETALWRARGVVCHNSDVSREIAGRFPKLPLLNLPLPYPASPGAMPRIGPAAPDEPIRLMMFGFIGGNRGLGQFVEAWRRSPWRDRFQLDVAGELAEREAFEASLVEAGLEHQTSIRGFVSDIELDRLIRAAHMVVNLRNPSMGEASGSQLRVFAQARASVVSNTGWYSLLPDECVYKIDTDNEVDNLEAVLADLAMGSIDLAAMGAAGLRAIKLHAPSTYAERLAQWLHQAAPDMVRQWTESALIDAVATGYADCLPVDFMPELPATLLARSKSSA